MFKSDMNIIVTGCSRGIGSALAKILVGRNHRVWGLARSIEKLKKIKNELGYDVPVDKSSRRYDFVIDNGVELFIIETNFYGGGGSKLKSTAGEYRNLSDVLNEKYKFFWITDGMGWKTTVKPLRETFNHNDYLFNLTMLEKGILEFLLK